MAKFILDGQEYGGGSCGSNVIKLTQAEYDALPNDKLSDDNIYLITDSGELTAENLFYDGSQTGLGNNVQDAMNVLNNKVDKQNKNLKFKLVGTATSASVLTLPDNFDELYIVSSIIGGWNIANTIHKEAITDNACIPVNTAHSHDTTFAFVGVIFPTKKQIKVHFASENDFIKTDDVSISVYYR